MDLLAVRIKTKLASSLFSLSIISRFSILVSIIVIVILQSTLPKLSDSGQNTSSLSVFINNTLGYCLILIPGYWLYKFAKQHDLGGNLTCDDLTLILCKPKVMNYNINVKCSIDNRLTSKLLKTLFGDKHDLEAEKPLATSSSGPVNYQNDVITFLYCFGGLQASYLVWGVIQEKMMSQVIDHCLNR